MKKDPDRVEPAEDEQSSELLILPDGRILVHNLTPAMACVLNELNPEDDTIKLRLEQHNK